MGGSEHRSSESTGAAAKGSSGPPTGSCVPAPPTSTWMVGAPLRGVTWFGLKYSAEWSGRCKDLSPGHVREDAQVGQREDGGWLTKDPLFIFSGADAN